MTAAATVALGAVTVALLVLFFILVRRSGYRDGLADASKILLESWPRAARDGPAVLAPGAMGEALRKVVGMIGSGKTGPVVSPPKEKPCPPCARGDHEICHGGYLDLAGKASCGCGCPPADSP